jgi:hypothetical protein
MRKRFIGVLLWGASASPTPRIVDSGAPAATARESSSAAVGFNRRIPLAHARGSFIAAPQSRRAVAPYTPPMHFDAHQPIIDDLEARILTIRDSL